MVRPFFLLLLLAFSSDYATAQKQQQYQLLWRIDGNNAPAPSYLFGTMHLQDERVFQFSDSVLYALNQCGYFATEIDFDDQLRQYARQRKEADSELPDTTDFLKKTLSDNEYQFVKKRLDEKAGVNLDQLAVKDPWIIERMIYEGKEPSVKQRDVYLDAYLYRLAKGAGKTMVGLEEYESRNVMQQRKQESFNKELFLWNIDEKLESVKGSIYKTYLDDLLSIYLSGDIRRVDSLLNSFSKRNSEKKSCLSGMSTWWKQLTL